MSEEEKQAIFYLKVLEDDHNYLIVEERQAIHTILNLIEKQQKEIEEYKEKMQEIINYTYDSEEEKLRQDYAYDRLKELLGGEDEK